MSKSDSEISRIIVSKPEPRIRQRRRSPRIHYRSIGKEGILMGAPSEDTYSFEPIPDSIKAVLYK